MKLLTEIVPAFKAKTNSRGKVSKASMADLLGHRRQ